MIHCAVMVSLERFISTFIEHTAGNFPLWLSPTQVGIVPISDKHHAYAREVELALNAVGIRTELEDGKDGLGKKIRAIREMKTPYWIVIGDAEMNNKTVTVEHITRGKIGESGIDALKKSLTEEIETKK
jgi:threonyl-tRNA synthetase